MHSADGSTLLADKDPILERLAEHFNSVLDRQSSDNEDATIVKGLSNQVPEIRCACALGCSYKRNLYTNMKPIQFSIN